jgi:hypothetical protein
MSGYAATRRRKAVAYADTKPQTGANSATYALVFLLAIGGWVAPGFEGVAEAFTENFRSHGDKGASLGVYVDGAAKVDLWGALRELAAERIEVVQPAQHPRAPSRWGRGRSGSGHGVGRLITQHGLSRPD